MIIVQVLIERLQFIANNATTVISEEIEEACDEAAAFLEAQAKHAIGKWLSAALDDPAVCKEMKADIKSWFALWHTS